jgi:hypothetical protein
MFSFLLRESTLHHSDKDVCVSFVNRNNRRLFCQTYSILSHMLCVNAEVLLKLPVGWNGLNRKNDVNRKSITYTGCTKAW